MPSGDAVDVIQFEQSKCFNTVFLGIFISQGRQTRGNTVFKEFLLMAHYTNVYIYTYVCVCVYRCSQGTCPQLGISSIFTNGLIYNFIQ